MASYLQVDDLIVPARRRLPSRLKVAGAFILSAAFFALAIRQVNFASLVEVLRQAHYLYVALAVGVYFLDLNARAIRWKVLLADLGDISVRRLYPVLAVGYMANNLLPGRVGELSRAYLVGQREKVSGSSVLATVAIERMIDGVTVLVLLLISLVLLPGTAPDLTWLPSVARATSVGFGLGLVGAAVLLVGRQYWVAAAHRALAAVWPSAAEKVVGFFDHFISGLTVLRDPWRIFWTMILSIVVWSVGALAYLLVAAAFDVQLTPIEAIATIAVVNLATALPQAPAGVGAFEAAAEQMLMLLGVNAATAFGITIVLHAVIFLPVVVVGLVALWRMNLPMLAPRVGQE